MLFGDVELYLILINYFISFAGDFVFVIILLCAMSGLGDFMTL